MQQESVKQLLQRFPLFQSLTDEEIEPVLNITASKTFRRGSHIFLQDDPLTNVYFIHQGKIKIYRNDMHGKEQIINVLKEGDMFPHQGFFRKDNYPANAETMEESILFYIPIHLFENFLINNPEVSIKIFRVLGEKIVELQTRLEEKVLRNTYEQIVLLLMRLSKNHGKKLDNGDTVLTTQFTNRDLASMIGSSRETVSRTLTQLKKSNKVYTDSKGDLVLDIMALHDELF